MCVGYHDGRLEGGSPLPDIHAHYSNCFDYRAAKGITIPISFPTDTKLKNEGSLKYAIVDTGYATFYRITKKKHFRPGADFPSNWEDTQYKKDASQRYSPVGTVGHYFGLTYDAALDESMYYGQGAVDSNEYFLLAIECYFEKILYLANYSVLASIWTLLGFPQKNHMEMMIELLNPDTSNELTDAIGLWARDFGARGLIYPTARYSQRQELACLLQHDGPVYPMINHVSIGCRMDFTPITAMETCSYFIGLERRGGKIYEEWTPIYADLNLVLFSGEQLRGSDRAVFYQTAPLELAYIVAAEDTRFTQATTNYYVSPDGTMSIKPRRRG